MRDELKEKILSRLSQMEGQVGFYFKNLVLSRERAVSACKHCKAASSCSYVSSAGTGRNGLFGACHGKSGSEIARLRRGFPYDRG